MSLYKNMSIGVSKYIFVDNVARECLWELKFKRIGPKTL